jgi:hypothetical protein
MFCYIDKREDVGSANVFTMPDDPCYEHGTLMDINDSLKVLETSLIITALAYVVFINVAKP